MTKVELANQIADLITKAQGLPPSREVALCITKLEEAVMWVVRSDKVDQQKGPREVKP